MRDVRIWLFGRPRVPLLAPLLRSCVSALYSIKKLKCPEGKKSIIKRHLSLLTSLDGRHTSSVTWSALSKTDAQSHAQ
ncbi:hypothetical protein GDO78_017026 [Eleutherodactylus coqui]|uniref:Uncharacterized protein n=1 Tax=Eleutherodactylus coqui TaxID=57060 RepID=A0A8J6EJU0_ELECQ|nr:hypothetical protein GDO78_017026 [Eleutherodactylus coqui]